MSGHDRRLLTFAEVAERLGVDVNTIRRNVKASYAAVVMEGSPCLSASTSMQVEP